MASRCFRGVAGALALAFSIAAAATPEAGTSEVERRIAALLAQMTLQEKLGQLQQLDGSGEGSYRPEHVDLARRRRVSRPAPPIEAALELVDHLRATLAVDAGRIYVTGFSMGASATWNALALRPDLFAAAIPVAGVPNPADTPRVAATPVWVLHGNRDETLAIQHGRDMYETFRRCRGAKVRFWELKDLGHVVPPPLLAGVEFQRWLFAHRKADGAPTRLTCGP